MTGKPMIQLVIWNANEEITDSVEFPLEHAMASDREAYEVAMQIAQAAEKMLQGQRRDALLKARGGAARRRPAPGASA